MPYEKSSAAEKVRLLVKMQMGIDKVRLSASAGSVQNSPSGFGKPCHSNAHWSGKNSLHLANHREATATVVPQIDDKCFSIGNKAKMHL